jgi:hypothetical protein
MNVHGCISARLKGLKTWRPPRLAHALRPVSLRASETPSSNSVLGGRLHACMRIFLFILLLSHLFFLQIFLHNGRAEQKHSILLHRMAGRVPAMTVLT